MASLNPYPVIFCLVGAIALYTGHRVIVKMEVAEAVKIAVVKKDNQYKEAALIAVAEANKKEEKLEQSALALEKVKDEEIARVIGQRDAAIKRLSDRPTRPSTPIPTKAPEVGEACTARELYREDAEFLVREAARADQVVAERNYYYQQYEKSRKVLHGIDSTN